MLGHSRKQWFNCEIFHSFSRQERVRTARADIFLTHILRIPEAVEDGFRGADPAILRMFEDLQVKVRTWNETHSDSLIGAGAGSTRSNDPAATPPRTSCRPIFGPGETVELGRTHVFSEDCVMTMEALEADHELLDIHV